MKTPIRHSIFWWLGTRTFIANSIVSGMTAAYLLINKQFPLVVLILILWLLSMVTWAEYRSLIKYD